MNYKYICCTILSVTRMDFLFQPLHLLYPMFWRLGKSGEALTYSPQLKGGSHFCFAFAFIPHGLDGFARTHYRVLRSLPITAVLCIVCVKYSEMFRHTGNEIHLRQICGQITDAPSERFDLVSLIN